MSAFHCEILTKTTACLVDDEGRAWDIATSEPAPELRSRFEFDEPGPAGAHYSPRTSGCVWIDHGARFVRIAFNPKSVRPAAIAKSSLLLRNPNLAFENKTAFCLTLIDGQHSNVRLTEIYASLDQSLNRMEFLRGEDGTLEDASFSDRFELKTLTLAHARQTPSLARLLDDWKNRQRVVDVQTTLPLWREEFEDRYSLLAQLPQGRGYSIIEIGNALRIPWKSYALRLNGAELNGMPDARYARWVSKAYDAVLASGAPDFQQITALTFWPSTGLIERRYRRLLVPWIDTTGRRLILSVNRPLPGE